MKQPGPRIRWWWLVTVLLAITLAACGGQRATPTPPPTPTPTPVPRLDVTGTITIRDLVALIPDRDAECVRLKALGHDYESFLDGELTFDLSSLPSGTAQECFGNETLVLLLVGQFEAEAGGLSDPSVACIRQTLGAVNLAGAGDAAPRDAGFGAAVGLLLCITDDEAERIEVTSVLGDASPLLTGMTLGDLRCVLESSDLQALSAAFEGFAAGTSPGPEIMNALSACAARS